MSSQIGELAQIRIKDQSRNRVPSASKQKSFASQLRQSSAKDRNSKTSLGARAEFATINGSPLRYNINHRNGKARFTRTFQIENSQAPFNENEVRNPGITQRSGRSTLSIEGRQTSSGLRWELQSRDSHLGNMLRNEQLVKQKLMKEQRYATIFNEFQLCKQAEREAKERFRQEQLEELQRQRIACLQMKEQNQQRLTHSRETLSADKNYHGTLHKRWRDDTWAKKRQNEQLRKDMNRNISRQIKGQVERQIYNINVKRMEEIQKQNQERYGTDLENLKSLSNFVQQKSEQLNQTEQNVQSNIADMISQIRQIRQCPKEKDIMLGYLEKQNGQRFNATSIWQNYFHEYHQPSAQKSPRTPRSNYNSSPTSTIEQLGKVASIRHKANLTQLNPVISAKPIFVSKK